MYERVLPKYARPNFWRGILQDVRLSWSLIRDPRVPKKAKIVPFLAVGYLISPFDIISFVPIIGQMDDLAILLLSLHWFVRLTPKEIVNEHRIRLGMEPV
jgi:uncharacterized membrane protein YkvA (DUF1232 family)